MRVWGGNHGNRGPATLLLLLPLLLSKPVRALYFKLPPGT